MAKIDRVIIKVNGNVHSFLNPVFEDMTEYEYFRTNPQSVNALSVIIPYNKKFLNDILIRDKKTFRMLKRADVILSIDGVSVEKFIITGIVNTYHSVVIELECPYWGKNMIGRLIREIPKLPRAKFVPTMDITPTQDFPML